MGKITSYQGIERMPFIIIAKELPADELTCGCVLDGLLALPFASISSKITGKGLVLAKSLQALAIQCRDIPGDLAQDHLGHNPRLIEDTISDTVSWLIDKNKVVDK